LFSPRHAPDRLDQFLDFVPLLNRASGREGIRHAMRHVVTQNLLLDLMERGSDRIDLRSVLAGW
jgi:hypothetical protein